MIVLDTHAVVWWASGDAALSATARQAIAATQQEGGVILISAITAWEIAMLIERGRLVLSMDLDEWLTAVQGLDGVRLVPLSPRVAIQSVRLPGEFHKDPADRMIVALSRDTNALLVTADTRIHAYPHVRCIW